MAEVSVEVAQGERHLSHPDGSGGYDYPALTGRVELRFSLPWESSFVVDIFGYDRLSGDANVAGSYRNLYFSGIGLRKSFLKYGFASLRAGLGYNDGHLNFAEGTVPLPDQRGMPLILSGQIGAQYCFGRHPCVEVFALPSYETNLIGGPDYRSFGLLVFGLGVSFDLGRTAPYEEYAAAVGRQRELQGALAASEERARRLQQQQEANRPPPEQHAANEPPPPQPTACPSCPACPPTPPPPRVPALLAENPLGIPIIFTNESPQLARREEREHQVRIGLSDPWLDRVANYLKSHANTGVRIHGHANDTGPEDQNITISNDRAQAVARYLRHHGVPERQIVEARGFGSSRPPVGSNRRDTMNRVVLFEEVPLQ